MATGDLVIRNIRALRWTGSNGALIAQMCGEIEVDDATWSVMTEVPGDRLVLLQVQAGGQNPGVWTIPAGKPWVLVSNDFPGVWANLSDASFTTRYTTWNEMLAAAVESSVINIPAYVLVTSSGELELPVLTTVAPNYTAVIQLRNAMPTSNYNVTWRAFSGQLRLGSIKLQAGKSIMRTTTTVTLPLRTDGVTTVAGLVTVEASALVTV